jgi:hypothetical protein
MLDKNTLRRASNLVDSEGVERLTVTLFHPGQGYCLPAPTKVWFRSRIVSWLRGLQQRKDIHDLRAETGPSLPPISSSFPPARHYRAWTQATIEEFAAERYMHIKRSYPRDITLPSFNSHHSRNRPSHIGPRNPRRYRLRGLRTCRHG